MKKIAVFIALVLLLTLSGVTPVLADGIPKLPHAFYGNVTINGAPAPDGTEVSATVSDGEIIPTQNPVTTVGGSYGINSQYLLVQGYDITDGATITFYVTNADGTATGGTAIFQAGGGPTRMDLAVTIEAPPPAKYALTMAVSPSGGGMATDVTNASPYEEGVSVSIKAEAAAGYQFVNWTASAGAFENANAAETTFTMPDQDATVTANFKLIPLLPIVATKDATGVNTTSATLNGNLTSLGAAASVSVSFEWGTTTAYGNETIAQEKTATGSFSAALSGLSSGTTYHFRAKAVGDGTSYGDDKTFTTKTYVGGGGGGAPETTTPPGPGTTDLTGLVDNNGVFLETVLAYSADGKVKITIPKGTIGKTRDGKPLTEITIVPMETPPAPPEGGNIIGLVYDFGPDGATFEPPITATFSYDPAAIPVGVNEEDLVIAYYDVTTGLWVNLPCVVDTANNKITASVSHFTTFAMIGTFTPAAFTLSSLVISPVQVAPGEKVDISLSVTNTGGMEGSYTVVLNINGVKEAEKSVIVAAGSIQTVTFSVAKTEAGNYNVTVDGLSGSFTVVAPTTPLPTTPPSTAPPTITPPSTTPPSTTPSVTTPPVKTAPPISYITWYIVGAVVIVIAIIVTIFLIRRRHD